MISVQSFSLRFLETGLILRTLKDPFNRSTESKRVSEPPY